MKLPDKLLDDDGSDDEKTPSLVCIPVWVSPETKVRFSQMCYDEKSTMSKTCREMIEVYLWC